MEDYEEDGTTDDRPKWNPTDHAREWLDNRFKGRASHKFSQRRWLLDELAALCVAQLVAKNEDEYELNSRLDQASDLVFSIWYANAPDVARRVNWGEEADKRTPEEQKEVERAEHSVWYRRDPRLALQEGFESRHYTSYDRDSIDSAIAEYLARGWLWHPFLTWVLVDMSVSRELCAFGEELKKTFLPGRKDFLGVNEGYFKHTGNLSKMRKVDWGQVIDHAIERFMWFIGIPVAAIFAAFYFGKETLGWWLSGGYALIVAIVLCSKIYVGIRATIQKLRGIPAPHIKALSLWDEMYEVWQRLEGPVINPARVKEAMAESAAKGAVWDNSTWALIDRVVARDPAAWTPQHCEA